MWTNTSWDATSIRRDPTVGQDDRRWRRLSPRLVGARKLQVSHSHSDALAPAHHRPSAATNRQRPKQDRAVGVAPRYPKLQRRLAIGKECRALALDRGASSAAPVPQHLGHLSILTMQCELEEEEAVGHVHVPQDTTLGERLRAKQAVDAVSEASSPPGQLGSPPRIIH